MNSKGKKKCEEEQETSACKQSGEQAVLKAQKEERRLIQNMSPVFKKHEMENNIYSAVVMS